MAEACLKMDEIVVLFLETNSTSLFRETEKLNM